MTFGFRSSFSDAKVMAGETQAKRIARDERSVFVTKFFPLLFLLTP